MKPMGIFICATCLGAALLAGCQVSGTEVPPAESVPEATQIVSGWQTVDGETRYLLPGGGIATGWLDADGRIYYLDENGAPVSGIQDVDGDAYIFDENGRLSSGWMEIDEKRYYSYFDGRLLTGWLELKEGRYYFDESGAMVTGWLELDSGIYYLREDGTAARGIVTIDGEAHFFASGGQELILVNPWNHVPGDYTVELTGIGGGHRVALEAYDDFQEMMAGCEAAGHAPMVRSSYRSQEQQEYLYERRIQRFEKQGYSREKATALAGTIVAVPGTSEHQLGLALDIVDKRNQKLDESQAETATQQWLMENSWRYGWILRYPEGTSESTGIIYEPWHYRYVGKEIAEDIHKSGLCLEDYLEALTE